MDHDAKVETELLQSRKLGKNAVNIRDDNLVDISLRGFWNTGQQEFYDTIVFYSNTRLYYNVDIQKYYGLNERERKKAYNERMLNMEQRTLVSIVLNSNQEMGRDSQIFYRTISSKTSKILVQLHKMPKKLKKLPQAMNVEQLIRKLFN